MITNKRPLQYLNILGLPSLLSMDGRLEEGIVVTYSKAVLSNLDYFLLNQYVCATDAKVH